MNLKKQGSSQTKSIVKATYLVFSAIIVFWTGVWIAKSSLERSCGWLATSQGAFLYWLTAKIILWIIPELWLLRISERTVRDTLNLANWKGWLAWGGGLGVLIALTGIVPNYLQGNPLLPTKMSFPLLNVIIIAPTLEEFLMRGAILGNLQRRYSFRTANIITSVMFVVLHMPGWYFMGVMVDNLVQPIGGALSIFLVSLAFGYAAHRSRSVMGGVISHFLNNLF
jgi:membrane protease YdiL (CAAX protease family)